MPTLTYWLPSQIQASILHTRLWFYANLAKPSFVGTNKLYLSSKNTIRMLHVHKLNFVHVEQYITCRPICNVCATFSSCCRDSTAEFSRFTVLNICSFTTVITASRWEKLLDERHYPQIIWGNKCKIANSQWILNLFPHGSRVNRLQLGWALYLRSLLVPVQSLTTQMILMLDFLVTNDVLGHPLRASPSWALHIPCQFVMFPVWMVSIAPVRGDKKLTKEFGLLKLSQEVEPCLCFLCCVRTMALCNNRLLLTHQVL